MRHTAFYNASRAHYFNWLEAIEPTPIVPDCDLLEATPDEVTEILNRQTLKNASKWGTIVFSAITLEAFINFYAEIHKMPDRREKNSNYGTKRKWRSYPNIVAGGNISDEAIKCVEVIFDLRDELVHYKPITGENGIPSFSIPHHGRALLNKVHCAVRSLDELKAPFHSSTWIGDDFEDALDWETS